MASKTKQRICRELFSFPPPPYPKPNKRRQAHLTFICVTIALLLGKIYNCNLNYRKKLICSIQVNIKWAITEHFFLFREISFRLFCLLFLFFCHCFIIYLVSRESLSFVLPPPSPAGFRIVFFQHLHQLKDKVMNNS